MFAIIASVILITAGFVLRTVFTKINKETEEKNKKFEDDKYYEKEKVISPSLINLPIIISVVLSILLIAVSCIAIVPTGYTGILTTFGRVEDNTINAGINMIAPWQRVVTMDNRTQKVHIDTSAFSSDIQQVDLQLAINYCIDQGTAQELYRTVGTNYYENIMFPRIQENTKAVIAQYTAENLIAKRDALSDQIHDHTSTDMKRYGITIVSIAIEDIDFTDAFTDAVEAKQVAAQNKLAEQTRQEQRTMEEKAAAERAVISANAEAEKAVIAANADLEVVKIQAEASLYAGQREAEMNQRIAEALSDNLIRYYWIKQWDGLLPTTVLGEGLSYMVDLGTNDKTE